MNVEEQFRAAVEAGKAEIDQAMKECQEALQRAIDASEKYGIPFYANPSGVGQTYQPRSYSEKWLGIDQELIDELIEYGVGEYEGWQQSAICY